MSGILAFFFMLRIFGMQVEKIPSTGTPPQKYYAATSVYDSSENRIITFGGYIVETDEYISSIFSFDLTYLYWNTIYPESLLVPPGLMWPASVLFSNNLYIFFGHKREGISSDVFKFNLETYSWEWAYLQGDSILGRKNFGYTTFNDSDTTYLAIFGGITHKGGDNSLFL